MRPRMTYSALQARRASSAKVRPLLTQWCNLPLGADPLDVADLARHAFAFHILQQKGCL